jgi:hypothetical protein
MMKKINQLFLGILLLLVLAMVGCGGGGGGGSTAVKNFKSWSQVEPDSTYQLSGLTLEINDSTLRVSEESTLRFAKDSKEQWTNLRVNTPSSTVSFSTANNDLIDYVPNSPFVFAEGVNEDKYAIIINPYDPNLEWNYQTFGIWAIDPVGLQADAFGFISAGAPTANSATPTEGTARYVGRTIGYYFSDNNSNPTYSDLTIEADFGDRSLNFATSNTRNLEDNVLLPDLNIINGSLKYETGNNSFTGLISTNSGLEGSADGKFYGPSYQEIGGVFETRGPQEFYGGAFGAKR